MGSMRPGVLSMGAKPWDRGARGWWVRVYAGGEKEAYRVADPGPEGEAEAKSICESIERRAKNAKLWTQGVGSQSLPIDGLLDGWIEIHGPLRSDRTQQTDGNRVAHLVKFFGQTDARDLSDGLVRKFANQLLETHSGHTVAGCLSILRRVLNLAAREKLIHANPVPTLNDIMRAAKVATDDGANERDAWSMVEWERIQKLAEQHEKTIAPALFFAFHTGARRGEIIALKWKDVDFSRHSIHFRRTAAKPKRGVQAKTKRLKSHFRPRSMPMSAPLEERLKRHLDERQRAQLQGQPMPEWVFPSPRGRFWTERNFSRTFERLRRRFAKAKVRPLELHCTRHSFISWALEAGKSVKRVSAWVGASEEVIFSTYSHLMANDDDVEFLGSLSKVHLANQSEPRGQSEARNYAERW